MSEMNERARFVNPVLLDDAARGIVGAASRALQYERYLDHLEHTKGPHGSLPLGVERNVGRSIQAALTDVQTAASRMLELVDELEGAGLLEALPHYLSQQIARKGPVEVDTTLARAGSLIETFVSERGLPIELWRWALPHVGLAKVTATSEEDGLRVQEGSQHLGTIVGRRSAFDLEAVLGENLQRKDSVRTPARCIRGSLQGLINACERRARRTATGGVQVLPTGVLPILIVLLVIAFVVFVVGLTITVLCLAGTIRDATTCELGVAMLIVGLLGSFVFADSGRRQQDDDPQGGAGPLDPDPPA